MGRLQAKQTTDPMDPPGGTIATRRSNALQLFVYMSRTKALGTSAFLTKPKMRRKQWREMTHLLPSIATYRLFSLTSCAGCGSKVYNRVGNQCCAGASIKSMGPNCSTASPRDGHKERKEDR